MKRVILYFIIWGIGVLMLFESSLAVIPVEDPIEWAKTLQVVSQLEQNYNTLKQQYEAIQQQYAAITGNYGWGTWHNSLSDLTKTRQWAADNWQQALQGLSGGNPTRYQQLLTQYQKNHYFMTQQHYAKGTNAHLARAYRHQVQTNEASHTIASYEFNSIKQHLKMLYQLGLQMEKTKNRNLKSALDLNSRIQLEIAYLSTEQLRMQALINEQIAQNQAHQIALENEASLYNQAGQIP